MVLLEDAEGNKHTFSMAALLDGLNADVAWADGESNTEESRKKNAVEDENNHEEVLMLEDEPADTDTAENTMDAVTYCNDTSAQEESSDWTKWLGIAAGVACAGLAVNWMRK
jgi:phosphoglycolate phosphatase-like HAD superfamily hydrolase